MLKLSRSPGREWSCNRVGAKREASSDTISSGTFVGDLHTKGDTIMSNQNQVEQFANLGPTSPPEASGSRETEQYRTQNCAIAGFLFANEFELEAMERTGEQPTFCFARTLQLIAALGEYASNSSVPCLNLIQGMRRAVAL